MHSAPTSAGLGDCQLRASGMSEVLDCAVAKNARFLCCLQKSEVVQTRKHDSIALMLRALEHQTGLPGKAYAKLSFIMEGVSDRVVPGKGE